MWLFGFVTFGVSFFVLNQFTKDKVVCFLISYLFLYNSFFSQTIFQNIFFVSFFSVPLICLILFQLINADILNFKILKFKNLFYIFLITNSGFESIFFFISILFFILIYNKLSSIKLYNTFYVLLITMLFLAISLLISKYFFNNNFFILEKEEFYKLGCELSVSSQNEQSYISLTGLDDNFEESVKLFEKLLANVVDNEEALENLKMNTLKKRADAKLNKQTILYSGMSNYAKYGPVNPFTNTLTDEEIMAITSDELIDIIRNMTSYEHRVLYYGPKSFEETEKSVAKLHPIPSKLNPIQEVKDFKELSNVLDGS